MQILPQQIHTVTFLATDNMQNATKYHKKPFKNSCDAGDILSFSRVSESYSNMLKCLRFRGALGSYNKHNEIDHVKMLIFWPDILTKRRSKWDGNVVLIKTNVVAWRKCAGVSFVFKNASISHFHNVVIIAILFCGLKLSCLNERCEEMCLCWHCCLQNT